MTTTPESAAIVKMLMDRAGLPASPDELAKLAAGYAKAQADIESLYAVAATRYEAPCLSFNPTPIFAEWG
jgi:hypothetical protein